MVAAATASADDCQVSEVAVYHALERRSKSLSSDLQVSLQFNPTAMSIPYVLQLKVRSVSFC